ncbi:MAG: redoxin family protein [Alteromonadaceae bacterium]|nr:redoxin family protein [Alteromonadaceae bacterium]
MKFRILLLAASVIILAPYIYAADKSSQFSASLIPVQGNVHSLAPLIGEKPLYIKLWATWCKPCIEQMPHFEHVQKTLGDKINVIAVNIDLNENDRDIDNVVDRFGLTMPVSRDNRGELARALGLQGTPYSVLVNTSGDIVYTGHTADDALDKKLSILANSTGDTLPALHIKNNNLDITVPETGTVVLFFSATWCDWYLADTRPGTAKQCEAGQKWISNANFGENITVRHVVNHLWTDNAALKKYKQKYGFTSDVVIDDNGNSFLGFNVRHVPTLIIVRDGKIIARSHNPAEFQQQVSNLGLLL